MIPVVECPFGSYSVPPEADVMIGRSIDSTIRFFDDVAVSRGHGVIGCRGGVMLVDLESLNGTFLNDHEVHSEAKLHDGDIVRVGGI